jgi:hypothetical protein
MTTITTPINSQSFSANDVFSDPVTYLASFGISSQVVDPESELLGREIHLTVPVAA